MSPDRPEDALAALSAQLTRMGVEHTLAAPAAVVTLPGTRKLKTVVGLVPGRDSLRVEAFVCRRPEEHAEEVHRLLLHRNGRMFGVGYAVDARGDIYLVGQLPARLADEDLDRLLGQVLEAADGDFNLILERGFASSIRREWAWRVDRGESLANLAAFRHLIDDDAGEAGAAGPGGGAGRARGGGAPLPE
ncbi:YbjN domain-containing protein [Corynebacterium sphenisci]|uniref:YbjN domain-containing protein n=1 Tax=Corynebacterium sphenisci TaxID=191493 RepID=UPI0026E0A2A1|nr:YbjN domain-containing protein [Corynebacterium sphenisci]MDO5730904.1 YbjN domain-containing protein [Corynebacterium sphenisci]